MAAGRWGAVAAVALAAACSGGGSDAATTTTSTVPTPTIDGDGTPFCDAMLAVGRIEAATGASPADVLEANAVLVEHLDEAQANAPADAPPDFEALLDDYRLATEAIRLARGDVERAFESLEAEHADVVQRLGSSSSHAEAYAFLVDRCGIEAGGG